MRSKKNKQDSTQGGTGSTQGSESSQEKCSSLIEIHHIQTFFILIHREQPPSDSKAFMNPVPPSDDILNTSMASTGSAHLGVEAGQPVSFMVAPPLKTSLHGSQDSLASSRISITGAGDLGIQPPGTPSGRNTPVPYNPQQYSVNYNPNPAYENSFHGSQTSIPASLHSHHSRQPSMGSQQSLSQVAQLPVPVEQYHPNGSIHGSRTSLASGQQVAPHATDV